MRGHLARFHPEQRGQLAGMRGEDRRCAPLERLELPERVRVEDDGQLEPLEQNPNELSRALRPPEPRSDRHGVDARSRLEHGVGGTW